MPRYVVLAFVMGMVGACVYIIAGAAAVQKVRMTSSSDRVASTAAISLLFGGLVFVLWFFTNPTVFSFLLAVVLWAICIAHIFWAISSAPGTPYHSQVTTRESMMHVASGLVFLVLAPLITFVV